MPTTRPGREWLPLPQMLARSVQEHGDRVLFRMRNPDGKTWRQYTYQEVGNLVSRIATYLKEQGVEPGDRVAVLGENRPEWGISYFAISWAGATIVPLDARATPHEWKHILNHSESKGILVSGRMLADILDFQEDVPSLKFVISMDKNEQVPDILTLGRDSNREPAQPHAFDLDDLAVILYTSGTTGSSKGVMLTHKNIVSNVDAIYQIMDIGPGDVFFSVLPIHHVFEATAGFLFPVYSGAEIVYARSLRSRELREDMTAAQPTLFLTVPLLLEKIYLGILKQVKKSPPTKRALFSLLKGTARVLDPLTGRKASRALFKSIREKIGFGRTRFIVSGGAALPRWISKGLEEMGFPVLQGYGLSETAPVLTVNPPCCPKNESVGLPVPGVEIEIVDPNEEGVGEIAARGPNVMKGYYKNPEATAEVLRPDGWFLTGDLGYLDDEGYLYITGRKKSVIVTRGGKNIYPEEIEEHLAQSPFIAEILVLMGRHPQTGDEELQAIVVPDFEALDQYAREHDLTLTDQMIYDLIAREIKRLSRDLAPYKRPKRFAIREEEFPKTTTRKIKRYLFQAPVQELNGKQGKEG